MLKRVGDCDVGYWFQGWMKNIEVQVIFVTYLDFITWGQNPD